MHKAVTLSQSSFKTLHFEHYKNLQQKSTKDLKAVYLLQRPGRPLFLQIQIRSLHIQVIRQVPTSITLEHC
jgi:hypothetical protein